jgi:catechol 2,3-dioxygenase
MIDSKPAGTNQPPSGAPAAVPATTRLGHVHLTVADLERELAFYQEVLGFRLRWREGRSAGLGAGAEDLLRLTELPGARPARNAAGLYHFAVLYPSRRELARAVARLFALRYPNSPTDHVVSKTTYLDDPEGQNIELYVRSPEDGEVVITPDGDISIRRYDGKPATGRDPVDVDALFEELTPNDRLDAPLAEGTRIGHVHLWTKSIPESTRFYRDVLGFREGPVSTRYRIGEVGLAADQPHVIAFNTWHGEGAPPPPADAHGLRYFTVVLPDAAELDRALERVRRAGLPTEQTPEGTLVRDPSRLAVVLTAAPSGGYPAS